MDLYCSVKVAVIAPLSDSEEENIFGDITVLNTVSGLFNGSESRADLIKTLHRLQLHHYHTLTIYLRLSILAV